LIFGDVVRCRCSGAFECTPHRMAAAVSCLSSAEHIGTVWEPFILVRLEEAVGNWVDWRRFDVEWPIGSVSVWVVREPVLCVEILGL
jgi:hypothetical protein